MLIGHAHEWQIEQPFTGIIHDIDVEFSALEISGNEAAWLILKCQAKLADQARAFRPGAFARGEGFKVVLIGKARQIIVWLGLALGSGDAPLGVGFKQGKARTFGHGVDKGGNEYGFAGP